VTQPKPTHGLTLVQSENTNESNASLGIRWQR